MSGAAPFFLSGLAGAPNSYAAAVLADSPLIYLKLDETSGTSYADSSGNGLTGTGHNTITQGQAGLFGGSSSSILFTTSNSAYIDFASDPYGTSYSGSLTVELFFRCTNLSQNNALFGKGMGGTDFSMYGRVNTDGSVQWGIVTTNGGVVQHDSASPAATVAAGTSYHALFRYTSGGGMETFINGALVASLAFGGNTLRNSALGLQVGQMITPIFTSANLDEVAFYGTALSNARVAAHYTARNT